MILKLPGFSEMPLVTTRGFQSSMTELPHFKLQVLVIYVVDSSVLNCDQNFAILIANHFTTAGCHIVSVLWNIFFFTKYLVRNKDSNGGILTKNNKICFSCEHLCAILCVHTYMCACMWYHVYWYVNTCVWLCKNLASQEDRYYHVFLLAEKTNRVMYPFR